MQPPVDVTALPAPAQRLLDPKSPAPLLQMAARGIAPGLKPYDALTVVALLAETEGAVAETARATLASLPAPVIAGAMVPDLPPGVLAAMAPHYAKNAGVMEKLLQLPQLLPETVADIAAACSEHVAELVATNEEKLLRYPAIIEKLYMNKATRMSTADRILELAVRNGLKLEGIPAFDEAAAEIRGQLIPEPSEEPTYDDQLFNETEKIAQEIPLDLTKESTHHIDEETGEEVIEPKFQNVETKLKDMTMTQKIRRAMLGTPSERAILVRDTNRNVARAAIKSPLIQENEVVRIAASRNVSDEVLGFIARSRDWTRSYQVKINLVQNPRTPFGFVTRLISHLFEHDLKALAKSKNVTGSVSQAARQQLQRKGKTGDGPAAGNDTNRRPVV